MNRHTIGIGTAALAALGPVLLLAGCGASSGAGDTAGAAAGNGAAPQGIHVAHTSLGDVLVDPSGHTLYLLTADSLGHSTCAAACASTWPPASTGRDRPTGVSATIGSARTPDGTRVVTVAGHPLYSYVADTAPGDVTGEGIKSFGGTWYAVAPDGSRVQPAGGGSGSQGGSGGSTGGGGYGY